MAIGCERLGLGDDDAPTSPSPPAAGSTIRYSALGASDAAGIGSSTPCLLIDCPDGMGYVAVTARNLRSRGYTVELRNLGIPTAVISPGFQNLGLQYGRAIAGNFLEHELPFVPRDTTVVTIFAGANDVNVITAAVGAGGADPAGYIDEQVRAFAADYDRLLEGIRARAGSPRIIALNLPNIAATPSLSGVSLSQRQAVQRAAVGITTTVINPRRSQGVIVVDLMCDPRTYSPSSYSSDGFHPSDAGYAIWATEVDRAMTSSSYPAPQAGCSYMSLY